MKQNLETKIFVREQEGKNTKKLNKILQYIEKINLKEEKLNRTFKFNLKLYFRVIENESKIKYLYTIEDIDSCIDKIQHLVSEMEMYELDIIIANSYIYKSLIDTYEITKFYKELSKFHKNKEQTNQTNDYKYLLPIRWVGAFNTGAGGEKDYTFREVLEYETSPKDREVAVHLLQNQTDLLAFKRKNKYFKDYITSKRVGIVYDGSYVNKAFEKDVYSINIGEKLVPTRVDIEPFESHYSSNEIFLQAMLEELFGQEKGESIYYEREYCAYDFAKVGSNQVFLQEIMDSMTDIDLESINEKNAYDICRKTLDRYCYYNDIYYVDSSIHSEGFLNVGAKPRAIVIEGEIDKKKYKLIKEIAKTKSLEIIYI